MRAPLLRSDPSAVPLAGERGRVSLRSLQLPSLRLSPACGREEQCLASRVLGMSLLLKALQQAERGSNLSLEPLQERSAESNATPPATPPASAKAAAALMLQKQANAEKRRMLFLLVALVLVVVGMAVYFYLAVFMPWVFLPKPPLVPPTPAPIVSVVPAQASPAAPMPTPSEVPLLRATPDVEQKPVQQRPAETRKLPPSAPSTSTASNERAIQISGGNTAPSAASSAGGVNGAYQLLQEGRLDDARRAYAKLRIAEPNNADILLGLGLIAQRQGRTEEAMQLYLKTLDTDPKNMFAHASLTSMIGRADPAAAEAKLKALIAQQPTAFLFFSLGNIQAAQGRWNEAQQAYFEAQRLDVESPDYAFNLAVSLERINQPRVALDYYQRALKLSQAKTAAFDMAQLKARIQQLSITK